MSWRGGEASERRAVEMRWDMGWVGWGSRAGCVRALLSVVT